MKNATKTTKATKATKTCSTHGCHCTTLVRKQADGHLRCLRCRRALRQQRKEAAMRYLAACGIDVQKLALGRRSALRAVRALAVAA